MMTSGFVATQGRRGPALSDPEDRFWVKVDFLSSLTGCWLWTASDDGHGYGQMQIKVEDKWETFKAYRLAWMFFHGPIPKGLTVDHRHTCPKRCVNPAHLRLCPQKKNNENRDGAYRNNKLGARGVSKQTLADTYQANVRHYGKTHYCGTYKTVEEAAEAARLKRLELFTHSDMDLV